MPLIVAADDPFDVERSGTSWGGSRRECVSTEERTGKTEASAQWVGVVLYGWGWIFRKVQKMSELFQSLNSCLDDHQCKQKELESVGELSEVCSPLFGNACARHEMGDQTSCGQWTNLLAQLTNGQELVTNVTCSRFMGCGDRSVTFIEQYQNTKEPSSRKLFAKWPIQNPNKRKPRCWLIVACGLRHHKRKIFSRDDSQL